MPLSFPALQGERESGPRDDNAAALSDVRGKGKLQYATMKKNYQGMNGRPYDIPPFPDQPS
jgi:hypothetical protein